MMDDKTFKDAGTQTKAVEDLSAVVLKEPSTALVPLEKANKTQGAAIRKRMGEIDMADSQSIIGFGSSAQSELQVISQEMLSGVRNKDVGPAGDSLRTIVTAIRGFSVSELDMRRQRTFWERLLGRAAPAAKFAARYEDVQGQIDKITDNLLMHEH